MRDLDGLPTKRTSVHAASLQTLAARAETVRTDGQTAALDCACFSAACET